MKVYVCKYPGCCHTSLSKMGIGVHYSLKHIKTKRRVVDR